MILKEKLKKVFDILCKKSVKKCDYKNKNKSFLQKFLCKKL